MGFYRNRYPRKEWDVLACVVDILVFDGEKTWDESEAICFDWGVPVGPLTEVLAGMDRGGT